MRGDHRPAHRTGDRLSPGPRGPDPLTAPRTAAVILAAGAGSRFAGERHKLLSPFGGKPLVVWALEHAVAAGLDKTAVVVGAVDLDAVVPPDVVLVRNDDWSAGQALSLTCASRWAGEEGFSAIVVGLGDQPLVPPEAWIAVAASPAPIAVATYDGLRRNPVRLARQVWDLLPRAGDEGARSLMRERPDLVSEVACPGSPLDVDRLEDLDGWS